MSIDWTKPLVVAGTDRVATVVLTGDMFLVEADWHGDGGSDLLSMDPSAPLHVTNAPPTPQIGPEHIEALGDAIKDYGKWPHPHDEMKIARLAEIRAYLESL